MRASSRCSDQWDHPRICGEHAGRPIDAAKSFGSSPNMRGALTSASMKQYFERVIPAYAESTWRSSSISSPVWGHPRLCGEHLHRIYEQLDPGSIPAYAGNTTRSGRTTLRKRNHPRVCGEHHVALEPTLTKQGSPHVCGEHISNPVGVITIVGSSPRMRGTPKGAATAQGGHGIIPAYAGNTVVA
jgi:hypothetical protein